MAQEALTVRIASNGRLSLPTKHRRIVGLENGGVAVVRVEDGEIRIRPVKSVVAEIQDLAGKYFADSRDNVDRFLADRRKEESAEE